MYSRHIYSKAKNRIVLAGVVLGSAFGVFPALSTALAAELNYPDNSYSSGDTLTADGLNEKFNQIKAGVNDNNGRISALEGFGPLPSDPNQLLNGIYVLTGQESCVEATSITPGLEPTGFVTTTHQQYTGTATFDGAGNATLTFSGTYLAVPFDHTSASVSLGSFNSTCDETYTVSPTRAVALSGACDTSFTAGSMVGETGSLTGLAVQGFVSARGDVLITTFVDGNVDQVSLTTGYAADRLCTNNSYWRRQ